MEEVVHMFKCLTDSLIRPKQIATHINMRIGKFILYFLMLAVFACLPNAALLVTSDSVSELYANVCTYLE